MAFSLKEQGERAQLIEHIKARKDENVSAEEKHLVEIAKENAIKMVNASSAEMNGFLVIASGEQGPTQGSIQVQVIGHKGHY